MFDVGVITRELPSPRTTPSGVAVSPAPAIECSDAQLRAHDRAPGLLACRNSDLARLPAHTIDLEIRRPESHGIDLFPGFSGTELLFDGKRLIGVRTGDRGIGKDGQTLASFEPGVDILAKAVVSARACAARSPNN